MPQPDLLLIEDDEAIAELIVWHFAREGFSVRQTPDGEQALILVEERVPDIVLLDWMIESLPGIEVCRRLRRNRIGGRGGRRHRISHRGRAASQHQRYSQSAGVDHCLAPDGTQAQGFGKSHRAIP